MPADALHVPVGCRCGDIECFGACATRVRERETSTFAMSSIIFVSVPTPGHTLKPLPRKGNRPAPFETMESSARQTEGF